MATKVVTARIPLPLAENVDLLGARMRRSRGWIIKQALAAWVEQQEQHHRLTHEALDDVEAGRVIDHQAVEAWAKSLGSASIIDMLAMPGADAVEVEFPHRGDLPRPADLS